jgi:hypothetical protein
MVQLLNTLFEDETHCVLTQPEETYSMVTANRSGLKFGVAFLNVGHFMLFQFMDEVL